MTKSCIKNLISNHLFFAYSQRFVDFLKFLCGVYNVHTNKIIYLSEGVKVVDNYLAALQLGQYPQLFTSTSLNNVYYS